MLQESLSIKVNDLNVINEYTYCNKNCNIKKNYWKFYWRHIGKIRSIETKHALILLSIMLEEDFSDLPVQLQSRGLLQSQV